MAERNEIASEARTNVGRSGFRWTLGRTLMAALCSVAAVSAIGVGMGGYWVARDIAVKNVALTLEESLIAHKQSLTQYLQGVEADVAYLAEARSTRDALAAFMTVWPEDGGRDAGAALRDAYIDANPHPLGEKHRLDAAPRGAPYDAAHGRFHQQLRSFLERQGYYDIFLVSQDGDVVYTVFKELDFATNLNDGPYKTSGLAEAFREAARSGDPAQQHFVDFAPYAPSYGAPAAFVATSIPGGDGGVLVVQLPSAQISSVVAGDGVLRSYLAADDGLLRTNLSETDESDILSMHAPRAVIDLALDAGAHVDRIGAGVLGAEAIQVAAPFEFLGARWVMVVEESVDVAFKGVAEIRDSMLWITAPILLGAAVFAAWMGRSMAQPVRRMRDAVEALAAGEAVAVPGASRRDEIGELARAMSALHAGAVAAQRVRGALDSSNGAIMVADENLDIVYLNPVLQRMLERSEAYWARHAPNVDFKNLVGQNIDVFHRDALHQRSMLAALETDRETSIAFDDRLFALSVSPVRDAAGAKAGFVVQWVERTETAAMERDIGAVIDAVAVGDFDKRLQIDTDDAFLSGVSAGVNRLCGIIAAFTEDLGGTLKALSEGRLNRRIDTRYDGRFGALAGDVNATVDTLGRLVGDIQTGAVAMRAAASEIADGAIDLSSRAESQASSLEETAATMEEMSATIKQNADNAVDSEQLAAEVASQAERGGSVVRETVSAMSRIEDSAKRIADIIAVIDGIAFQTNLLALNAAVEAARAGETGKGFAVVASEVRTLAQRSADAAKDISALIAESTTHVSEGVTLVDRTGESLSEIVGSVDGVVHAVRQIASATREQASGVQEVSSAVNNMDEMTQRNASLSEESASAARRLADEADRLAELVAYFVVDARPQTQAA